MDAKEIMSRVPKKFSYKRRGEVKNVARLPACSLGKSLSLVAGYVRCASPFRDVRNASRESSAVSRPRKVNCKVADHPRDLFRIPLLFLGIVSHSFLLGILIPAEEASFRQLLLSLADLVNFASDL